MAELLYEDETYALIGAAQKVHRTLGPGFPESVYHRALCQELVNGKVVFESQKPFQVFYAGTLCGEFRIDILVDGKVVAELKAVDDIVDDHVAQVISYLRASKLEVGVLINFGKKSLEIRRVSI